MLHALSFAAAVALSRLEVLFEEVEAVLAQEQVRVGEKVADVEVAREDRLGAGEVLEGAADDHVRRGKDDEGRVVEADGFHQVDGLLGLRLIEDVALDDSDLAVDRLLAERRSQRQAAHLLRHPLLVAARVGAENRAAALPGRFADRALTRAAGAFLAVGLRGTAGAGASRVGRRGALAGVGGLAATWLGPGRHVRLLVQPHLWELVLALARAHTV